MLEGVLGLVNPCPMLQWTCVYVWKRLEINCTRDLSCRVMARLLCFEVKWKTKITMHGTSYVEWLNYFKHASSEFLG